uniref:Uncharacterized protein n=1 Tax=Branchiostoma floridae TaxID=7739 RepID=C3ZKA4_BRAFL|eukprot:XP_002590992.1 hypothetical protein BRAFLDRAFT_69457 [Branchiostoma floridae]
MKMFPPYLGVMATGVRWEEVNCVPSQSSRVTTLKVAHLFAKRRCPAVRVGYSYDVRYRSSQVRIPGAHVPGRGSDGCGDRRRQARVLTASGTPNTWGNTV